MIRNLALAACVTLTAGIAAVAHPSPAPGVVATSAVMVGPASVRGTWPTTTTTAAPRPRRAPRASRSRPAPAPARTYPPGVEQWRALVAAQGGWDVNHALRIMRCESGGNPQARNRRSSASGLFQAIRSTWGGWAGYPEAWLAPPAVQIAHAHALWQRRGWQPWVCR